MAQFDVHRLASGLVVDCQSSLLEAIDSRFVVPLVPVEGAPKAAQWLNPVFSIAGVTYVMLTQAAGAVRRNELGPMVTSLSEQSFEITGALDVLISGV